MSRRDTIIIAVLVNAGLLIVLFSSALKSNIETPITTVQTTPPPVVHEVKEVKPALPSLVFTPQETPAAPQNSFAEDLKSFAIPEQPLVAAPPPAIQPLPALPEPVLDFIEIKVKKGDVLEKLARHHQTSVAEIMQLNHLGTTNLRIGQSLKIANPALKKSDIISQSPSHVTTVTKENKVSESGAKYYTVKKGDNPWTIAVKNHMKVDDLLKLNNLSEEQARRLKPGDQLRIQ
jgi:LysM repeat protein